MVSKWDKQERHLCSVTIHLDFVIEMITEGWKAPSGSYGKVQCIKGLPKDARYIRQFYDPAYDNVCFVFEHPSFDLVPHGGIIPRMLIEYEQSELEILVYEP